MYVNVIFQIDKNKLFSKTMHNTSIITDFECKTPKFSKEVTKYMVKLKCCVLLLCLIYPNDCNQQ